MGAKSQQNNSKFLSPHTRKKVLDMLNKRQSSKVFKRLSVLKLIDEGYEIKHISAVISACERTVKNIKSRFLDGGLCRAIYDQPRSGRPLVIKKMQTQKITAIACSDPPDGYSRWTLELLREKAISNNIVKTISKEKVRIILMEHDLKPWKRKMWCVPNIDDEFVERMEDILDLYEKKANPQYPVICMDEKPIQLLKSRYPDKVKRGIRYQDYEYVRNGTANAFCVIEPKRGRHLVKITARRTSNDFAEIMALISSRYKKAKKIHVVMDNLNTHKFESLAVRFGKNKAKKIWGRFKVHYTPKHASWLNQAEIQINMFNRQCLGYDRIDNINTLRERACAWASSTTKKKVKIDWKFTKSNARKISSLKRGKN